MSELREKVRAALPKKVLELADEIEAFAGQDLAVKEDPNPVSETDPNPLAARIEVSHDGACIYLPDPQHIDPRDILHELLHAHRYWVEGIPQMMPLPTDNSDGNWYITSSIENAIEHMVIVPRETDYGFDPYPYWNATNAHVWALYPWPNLIGNHFIRRKDCLLGWLDYDLVTDDNVRKLMEDSLKAEGLYEEAEKFRKKMRFLMSNKPRQLACAVRFLNIPRNEARVAYLDIKTKERRSEPIPFV